LGLEKRDEFIGEVQLASKADVVAKARRLEDGTRTMGVVVELRTKPQPRGSRSAGTTRTATRRTTARLPGRAKATRALDAEIDLVAQDPGPTLITGELGVGKRHAAAILHRRWSADAEMVELDLSLLALDDVRSRLAEVGEQLTSGTTVVLRHVHALAESDMGTLVALIEQASDTAGRLVVTGPDVPEPRAARVYAHFGRRIGVTPLASRTEEIADIANEVLAQRAGRNGPQRLQAATLQSLMARSWPGNVRELVSVIESAASRALGGDIGLQHLPAGYRESRPSRAHAALERAELETLLTVLKESGGNKSLAAQRLGVARSTLYRKVREYGIDTDRFVNP
jgi:DNA-binding NtrC family response regulator